MEVIECVLVCFVMIGCYYGYDIDLFSLCCCFSILLKGVDLKWVVEIVYGFGFEVCLLCVEIEYFFDV